MFSRSKVGEWTLDSLYQHFREMLTLAAQAVDVRFNDNDRAVHAALESARMATANALAAVTSGNEHLEKTTDQRFDQLNEHLSRNAQAAEVAVKAALDSVRIATDQRFAQIDTRFSDLGDAHNKALNAALESTRIATEKAETASEKRFDAVNEFRQTLKDQQGLFVTRSEVYALIGAASAITAIFAAIFGIALRLLGH